MKVFLGIMLSLALLSGIYLLFAKPKRGPIKPTPQTTQSTNNATNNTASTDKKKMQPKKDSPTAPTTSTQKPQSPTQTSQQTDRKVLSANQWKQCHEKTLSADTQLLWSITITSVSAIGGSYANGLLNGDTTTPVQVYAKSDSANAEEIKEKLMNPGTLLLRGTCMGNAGDGNAILFEAY